ncbi:MAG: M23 family metallopeptidase [Spirochaetaceae bacterium]|jgi:murein DD-endopeptidase MepM/ murein hydrolase activator NlpD|nr:M23 family metallopeptidase [Spirochaetaceae bacterium]
MKTYGGNRAFLPVFLALLALPWFASCQSGRTAADSGVPVPGQTAADVQSRAAAESPAAAADKSRWEFKAVVLGSLKPGEPFVAAISGMPPQNSSAGAGRIRAVLVRGDRELNRAFFFDTGEYCRRGPVNAAVMAVPSTAGAGKAALRIEAGGRVLETVELTIGERFFSTETINITENMSDILTRPDPEKTRQAEQMWAIWARTGDDVYTPGNFIMPVKSEVQTSRFGGRRIYKYPDGRSSSSIHAGVDWRAPTGTPLYACAPGKVVLARMRIVTGNTVVIEHMPGVYSLCYHMDKITVAEGDMVQTGTRLGDAGATGFATGAHLHWEVRVATENTDPAAFLGRKILDTEAILAILNE